MAIPYGIYDLKKNEGYVCIGNSKNTSEFACDSIRRWWQYRGRYDYSESDSILVLADGGGSNSSRSDLFKVGLQEVANVIGVEIRVAHYPPYTSKWNPIEHRLFPHITRAMQGVILKSVKMVKELIEKTSTSTGLIVKATMIHKIYQKGMKATKEQIDSLNIIHDQYLGKWNYRILPNVK